MEKLLRQSPAIVLLLGVVVAHPHHATSANASQWELVPTATGERAFVTIALHPVEAGHLWAGSPHALYESTDDGVTWRQRLRLPREARAMSIALDRVGTSLLLATDQGLYGSMDGGERWARVFQGANQDEAACTHVAFHPVDEGAILLGSRGGLFLSADRGVHWQAIQVPAAARHVARFSFDPKDADRVYLVSLEGLFTGSLSTGAWERRFTTIHAEEPPPAEEASATGEVDEPDPQPPQLIDVAVDPQQTSTVYLATSHGLERSLDGGLSWQPLPRAGLQALGLSKLLLRIRSPTVVFAATDRGVTSYDPRRERWTALVEGLTAMQVHDLAASHDTLWAATDDGLFRLQIPPDGFTDDSAPTPQDLLSNFIHEPSIAQVREAAIRYAEVSPRKIASWRTQARLKALVPKVSITGDTNLTDFRHWDSGTNPDSLLTGKRDLDWTTNVIWELGDVIWSADQTSIDVRSKLMVELRDDIVDEVTRLYFERRRLQVLLLLDPPTEPRTIMEKELRIQELTALIDGMTGGMFSGHMTPHPQEGAHGDTHR